MDLLSLAISRTEDGAPTLCLTGNLDYWKKRIVWLDRVVIVGFHFLKELPCGKICHTVATGAFLPTKSLRKKEKKEKRYGYSQDSGLVHFSL
jgi:hypothetical protein